MPITRLEVPEQFHRNSQRVLALGVETTGMTILESGNQLLGWPDLAKKDVLDIGCGVRFTQTIMNRSLPIGSYTGIDIDAPLIAYLADAVQDRRFSFHYWHIYNELFNRSGERLTRDLRLPLAPGRTFDLIWMYSVVTHTYPADTACLLAILTRYLNADGRLIFSALLDPAVATFEDRVPGQPLAQAYYNEAFLRQIIAASGWQVEARSAQQPDTVMQNLFLCRPSGHRWRAAAWLRRRLDQLRRTILPAKPGGERRGGAG